MTFLPGKWLRATKWKAPVAARTRGGASRTRPHPFVLRLDALEDRAVPSTFTVLNLADSGAGSLRQAVLDANAHPGRRRNPLRPRTPVTAPSP